MHIDASVIRVSSLESAVEFWTTVGGMEVTDRQRGWAEVEHPATRQRLRLVPQYGYTQAVSLMTDDLDNAILEMTRLLGATVVNRGCGPELECAQLEDSAGVRYGVCQPVPADAQPTRDCVC